MHLRQSQFTYSSLLTKHKQRIQKFKETGDTKYIYKNELDKPCFAHDAAYSDIDQALSAGLNHFQREKFLLGFLCSFICLVYGIRR